GHRHAPFAVTLWAEDARPLEAYNAGCSTEPGRLRLFSHGCALLARQPLWIAAQPAAAVAAYVGKMANMKCRMEMSNRRKWIRSFDIPIRHSSFAIHSSSAATFDPNM